MKISKLKATRIARDIGQVFAIMFIFAELFFNPFLIIIGFIIFPGAWGEYEMRFIFCFSLKAEGFNYLKPVKL